jgi:hypothetical protein
VATENVDHYELNRDKEKQASQQSEKQAGDEYYKG